MDALKRARLKGKPCPDQMDWQRHFFNLRTLPLEMLYRLLGSIEARHELYRRAIMTIVMLAASAPAWFGLSIVMGIARQFNLAAAFIAMTPCVLLLSAVARLCLHCVFAQGFSTQSRQLEEIKRELARRDRYHFTFVSDN